MGAKRQRIDAALLSGWAPVGGLAAEEIKLQATATWECKGNLFLVGDDQALSVATSRAP